MSDTPRSIVEQNAETIESFTKCLQDAGIGVQIIEAIAKGLFGNTVENGGFVVEGSLPSTLFSTAFGDIIEVSMFGSVGDFDIERVIAGGASFEFLVRYASKVDPLVIPADVIPSDETVDAILVLFQESRSAVTTS